MLWTDDTFTTPFCILFVSFVMCEGMVKVYLYNIYITA